MALGMHLFLPSTLMGGDEKMNSTCNTNDSCETTEPKHFMIWVALWIAALMVLLPALGR